MTCYECIYRLLQLAYLPLTDSNICELIVILESPCIHPELEAIKLEILAECKAAYLAVVSYKYTKNDMKAVRIALTKRIRRIQSLAFKHARQWDKIPFLWRKCTSSEP